MESAKRIVAPSIGRLPRRSTRRGALRRTLRYELFERRDLLATYEWIGKGADDNWSTPANWQELVAPPPQVQTVPSGADGTQFDVPGPYPAAINGAKNPDGSDVAAYSAASALIVGGTEPTFDLLNHELQVIGGGQ